MRFSARNTRVQQLPALPTSVAPLTLHMATLSDEALYLASMLRARLSDSALGGDGRGLLSRALARGELDQFLFEFFSNPGNLLFAKSKVEARRRKKAKLSASAPYLLDTYAAGAPIGDQTYSDGAGSDSFPLGPTRHHHQLNRGAKNSCTGDGGRFGPLLADYNDNHLPGRGALRSMRQGDDVSDLENTTTGAVSERSSGGGGEGARNESDSAWSSDSQATLLSEAVSTRTTSLGSKTCGTGVIAEPGEQRRRRRPRKDWPVENMHFESHLLHRVCAVTGKIPVGNRKGSDGEETESLLLHDVGEVQLLKLRRNPQIMGILVRLKALSVYLLGTAGCGVDSTSPMPTTPGGRRGQQSAIGAIRHAQQEYLRLFEGMLAELLRVQREASKAAQAEKDSLQRELERVREVAAKTKAEADIHAVQLEALLSIKQALATEVATQKELLNSLATEADIRVELERTRQNEHFEAGAKKQALIDALKEEEKTMRLRFKEVEVEATKAEAGVRSMEHLTKKAERTADLNKQIYRVDESKYKRIPESTTAFTQTIADDDGLWDFQDGLTRHVSRNVLQRLRWQACRRFVSCPACHGLGNYAKGKAEKKTRKLVPSKERSEEDPTLFHRFQKRRKVVLDRHWAMPNVLVEFLSHLPKTAQALPIKSLRWLTREMWLILDERERIDTIDAQEGQHVQIMNDFIVELFLRRHSLRQDAELQLYIFLVSLKTHYKKTAAAHTFARLLNLLEDGGGAAPDGTGGSHDHDSAKGKVPKEKDKRDHTRRGEEMPDLAVQPHNSPLGTAFLPVLLFTRRALLKRPAIDPDVMKREKALQRFAGGAAIMLLQEAVQSAYRGGNPAPDTKLSSTDEAPAGADQLTEAAAEVEESAPPFHPLQAAVRIRGYRHEEKATTSDERAQTEGASQTAALTGSKPAGEKSAGVTEEADRIVLKPRTKRQSLSPKAHSGEKQRAEHPLLEDGRETERMLTVGQSLLPKYRGKRAADPAENGTESVVPAAAASAAARTTIPSLSPSARGDESVVVGGDERKDAKEIAGHLREAGGKKRGKHRAGNSTTTAVTSRSKKGDFLGKKAVKEGEGASDGAVAAVAAEATAVAAAQEAVAAGKQQDSDAKDGEAEVPPVDLPRHVLTEDYCTFFVSLEVAVRVLIIVLHWCPTMKKHTYVRALEKNAALLTSRGQLTGVEACHSFIRSAMRKTIASVESELSNGFNSGLGNAQGTAEGLGGAVPEDADGVPQNARVVVDMDRVVQLVMEVLLLRQNSIEHKLKVLFTEGDDNGDGVLSFEEFNHIVTRAAPHFSERRVLRMFREALTSGREGSFAIEKDTFCRVCQHHGLVQLIDILSLERAAERGQPRLQMPPSPSFTSSIAVANTAAATARSGAVDPGSGTGAASGEQSEQNGSSLFFMLDTSKRVPAHLIGVDAVLPP